MTAVVGTAIMATTVTALVLEPSGARELTSSGYSITVARCREADQASAGQRKQARAEWQRIIDEQPDDNHSDCSTHGAADNAHPSSRQRDRQGGPGHHPGGSSRPPGLVGVQHERSKNGERYRHHCRQSRGAPRPASFERAEFGAQRAGDPTRHRRIFSKKSSCAHRSPYEE
jgi:hypothetical protein